jgi:hypothetical protein
MSLVCLGFSEPDVGAEPTTFRVTAYGMTARMTELPGGILRFPPHLSIRIERCSHENRRWASTRPGGLRCCYPFYAGPPPCLISATCSTQATLKPPSLAHAEVTMALATPVVEPHASRCSSPGAARCQGGGPDRGERRLVVEHTR